MKNIMIKMSILMGFTMSLVLSFVGTFTSGHFSLMGWLFSFGISFAISLVIGFLVPVKRICDSSCNKCAVNPESFKGNLLSSLVSDLIYTPVITVIMVVIMVLRSIPAGANVPVAQIIVHAVLSSLAICLVVGYVVILIVQPVYLRLLLKGNKK